jgi:tetratricopeptide (TPR) repeat protein
VAAACWTVSCQPKSGSAPTTKNPQRVPIDPLAIALAPHAGDSRLDQEIRRLQQRVRDGRSPEMSLEQLGWAFVAKARESFDPGFYKLAESCALAIEQRVPQSPAALLLRGHVLHSQHRFQEAQTLARQLVNTRGLSFDFGLLGDVLMEQGKLQAAVEAYQHMIDLKPELHAYARVAHLRWLKGDVEGAIKAMKLAVGAASPQDAESAAWVNTRLALYEFQSGQFQLAEKACAIALSFQSDYAPALLLRGRMLLAQNRNAEAAEVLATAAKINPLPEYQWTLAEALRAADREPDAAAVEQQLRQSGAAADPRTLALYLATRLESIPVALALARAELDSRGDVFTHDAFAWSLAAAGRFSEAQREMDLALAEGTEDGRLFFHAAAIASRSGHDADARRWLSKANGLAQLLLPSERAQLQTLATADVAQVSKPAVSPISKSADRRNIRGADASITPAGLETRDTAGLETCATKPRDISLPGPSAKEFSALEIRSGREDQTKN